MNCSLSEAGISLPLFILLRVGPLPTLPHACYLRHISYIHQDQGERKGWLMSLPGCWLIILDTPAGDAYTQSIFGLRPAFAFTENTARTRGSRYFRF